MTATTKEQTMNYGDEEEYHQDICEHGITIGNGKIDKLALPWAIGPVLQDSTCVVDADEALVAEFYGPCSRELAELVVRSINATQATDLEPGALMSREAIA